MIIIFEIERSINHIRTIPTVHIDYYLLQSTAMNLYQRKTIAASSSTDPLTMKQNQIDGEDDTDSITEGSSMGSVSSDDSFGPQFAINTLRYAVFGKVKSSARGLARKSKAKLSPVLQRGSSAVVSGLIRPRRTRERVPVPLTPQQQESRRRRRNNATKIYRMLQRINHDPFVASRVVQAFSVLFLLLGDRLSAACTSFISVLILHQTTQLASTNALQAWYYVGIISLVVSVGSMVVSKQIVGNLQDARWVWGQAVPRLWGVFLALWLYQDIEASKDGNDNAIQTVEIELSLLQARFFAESSLYRQWKNLVIVVQHGPIVLGKIGMKDLFEHDEATANLQYATFSHFIESSEGSSLHCRLELNPDSREERLLLGTAKVRVPTTLDLKMTNWFPIFDPKKQRQGELMVQIESRKSATNFLFRASTILPTVACFAVASWCR